MANYLTDCFEEGGTALFLKAIGEVARARGMSELANRTGLTRASLYKALAEDGNPAFDTLARVLDTLGFRLCVVANTPASPAARDKRSESNRVRVMETPVAYGRKRAVDKEPRARRRRHASPPQKSADGGVGRPASGAHASAPASRCPSGRCTRGVATDTPLACESMPPPRSSPPTSSKGGARPFGFHAPPWAEYVACDFDGMVWAFQHCPVADKRTRSWTGGAITGRYSMMGSCRQEIPNWEEAVLHRHGGLWRSLHAEREDQRDCGFPQRHIGGAVGDRDGRPGGDGRSRLRIDLLLRSRAAG